MVEATLKKWGNSYAVIVPKEVVEEHHLKLNDKVNFFLVKEADLTPLYGKLKIKMSGQAFKNMVRKGWE